MKKELIIIFIIYLVISILAEFWILPREPITTVKYHVILGIKSLVMAITMTVIYYLFERRKKKK